MWDAYSDEPYFQRPDGTKILMKVDNYVPYLVTNLEEAMPIPEVVTKRIKKTGARAKRCLGESVTEQGFCKEPYMCLSKSVNDMGVVVPVVEISAENNDSHSASSSDVSPARADDTVSDAQGSQVPRTGLVN